MSEKHLSEAPWKSLVSKEKIKDSGLGKALAFFNAANDDDYEGRLKDLLQIEKAAAALKKEHDKKNTEVVDYLTEVLKQVVVSRKALELSKKGAENEGKAKEKEDEDDEDEEDEGEEDEETAEYRKDLKTKLVSALNQVKSHAPDPEAPGTGEDHSQLKFMAYVAGAGCGVLIARNVSSGAKKLLKGLAGGASGGAHLHGDCIFEKGVHTFVLDKVPGGLARKLGKAILDETGVKYRVRVRSRDGTVDLDSDTDTGGEEQPGGAPTGQSLEEQWKKLKAELFPSIEKAISSHAPSRDAIIALARKATELEKARNFQGAIDSLVQVKPLLGEAPKTEPTTTKTPAEEYDHRVKELLPALQKALKEQLGDTAKIRAVIGFAREKAGEGHHDVALKALEAVGKLLGAAGLISGVTPAPGLTAMPVWKQARLEAITKLKQMAKDVEEEEHEESANAVLELEAVIKNLPQEPNTLQLVTETGSYLENDTIVFDVCELAEDIRTPLVNALAELKKELAA